MPLRAQLAKEKKKAENGKDIVRPLKLVIMSATLRVADFVDNSK